MAERRIPEWAMAFAAIIGAGTGLASLWISMTALSRADQAMRLDHASKRLSHFREIQDEYLTFMSESQNFHIMKIITVSKRISRFYERLGEIDQDFYGTHIRDRAVAFDNAAVAIENGANNTKDPDTYVMTGLYKLNEAEISRIKSELKQIISSYVAKDTRVISKDD